MPMVSRHDEHAFTDAPSLLDLEAVILAEGEKPISKPSADGLPPTEDPRVWPDALVHNEHNLLVEGSQDCGPVAPIYALIDLAHEIHVLLRHRLLPRLGEPFGGCPGLVDVGVVREANDQAVYPLLHRDSVP